MKKTITLFLFLISIYGSAQGNLQFNRVVTLTSGDNYTTPAGKVLKIESISMTSGTICIPKSSTGNGFCQLQNGTVYPYTYGIYDSVDFIKIGSLVFKSASANGVATSGCNSFNTNCVTINITDISNTVKTPLWLETGKQVTVYQGSFNLLISAIEFNIVP